MKDVTEHTTHKGTDRTMTAFLILTIAANVLVITALAVAWWTASSEFQPFRFPEQKVLNRLPGHGDQASAYFGEPIIVRGTKCNTSDEPVVTHGTKTWSSVAPPGSATSSFAASGKAMQPGCGTRTYVNTVPPLALSQMQDLLKKRPYVIWQITATLTAEHKHGATRSWQTQPFYIYPKEK